jgi:two-component system chemotaxis sensor kinase CheA
VLERPLRPGEVSLDDLERAFRETETEAARQARAALSPNTAAPRAKERQQGSQGQAGRKAPSREPTSRKPTRSPTSRSASTWTRSNI